MSDCRCRHQNVAAYFMEIFAQIFNNKQKMFYFRYIYSGLEYGREIMVIPVVSFISG